MSVDISNRSAIAKRRRNLSKEDRIYYVITYTMLGLLSILMLYPLVFILSASFSSPQAVSGGRVFLWPVEPSLEGYRAVFKNKQILIGYGNTIFYTAAGTLINVALSMAAAYPLARRSLPFGGTLMFLFTFTMLFSGGTIPNHILIQRLNMYNTRWALLLPGAISVYNMIIARTFIQNIPKEIHEAAQIDGCSDIRLFFDIILPLSKSVIAVLTLYYAVAHWNAYFDAFLYLSDRKLYPLQIALREVLIANSVSANDIMDAETMGAVQGLADLLKYSLIVVSSAPVLMMYPFVQRHFVKGVMIGSIKG